MARIAAAAMAALHRSVEAFLVALFAALVAVALWQVFNRFALNASLSWSEESQRYTHIWLVFLGIAVAYRRGAHIGVDLLLEAVPPRAARGLVALADAAWLALGLAIAAMSLRLMAVAGSQMSPGLEVSMDRVYLGLVLGGAYLALVAAERLVCRALGAELAGRASP